jgi:hypothetical protein
MTRNMKTLGLVFAAILAMSVVASPASALNFTAAKYPVTLSGNQAISHHFTVTGSTMSCSTTTFSGSATTASATQTFTPTYTGCNAFGFIGATVTGFPNTGGSCDYLLNANTGNFSLNCASGDVTIDAGPCTVTLTAAKNTSLTSSVYTNNTPAAGQITIDTNVTNIHAEVTKSEFGCPIVKGTHTNATYTGTTVVKGTDSMGNADAIDVG